MLTSAPSIQIDFFMREATLDTEISLHSFSEHVNKLMFNSWQISSTEFIEVKSFGFF